MSAHADGHGYSTAPAASGVRPHTRSRASSSGDRKVKRTRVDSTAAATVTESTSPALALEEPSKDVGIFSIMAKEWVEKEMAWYFWDGEIAAGRSVTTAYGQGYVEGYHESHIESATNSDDTRFIKIKLAYGTLFCPKQNLNLGTNGEYRPIDNAGSARVPKEHLEKARNEYAERFAFCTEEEDASSHGYSGSPFLLVAANVKSTWTAPEGFESLRFMLVPVKEGCALFITLMAGVEHGSVDGAFSDKLGYYLVHHGLELHVEKCHSGGGIYQPDIRIYPSLPSNGPPPDNDPDVNRPYSRLVVEFEFANRNASKLREVGFGALNNSFATLFLGIKVWKKTQAGVFGAAAVLWRKDHATGNLFVQHAFDFGTKRLSNQSRNAWAVNLPANRLPAVHTWTSPLPINSVAAAGGWIPPFGAAAPPVDPAWVLTLPKALLLYCMPSAPAAGSPYLPAVTPGVPDFQLDLKSYQKQIHGILLP